MKNDDAKFVSKVRTCVRTCILHLHDTCIGWNRIRASQQARRSSSDRVTNGFGSFLQLAIRN
jgi:hypothetical protein